MKILVLNSGSSSIKFQLFNMENEHVLAKGRVTRINNDKPLLKYETHQEVKIKEVINIDNHSDGLQVIKKYLMDEEKGVITNVEDIKAIGHRVVHGGEKFSQPTIVDEKVENKINQLSELAPLHNPHNLTGIKECKEVIPDTPQVAVFDTGFHQSLPEKAYIYAIPYQYYEKYGIRRYGFHGTSHKFVAQKAADMMNTTLKNIKVITCHLGNGASMAAIKEGKSIDTTMGLTPLEGLVMGTRSGDIDPSIISFLVENENLKAKEVEDILNTKSGLLGVSGVSNDFREINQAAKNGNHRAKIALKLFYYRIQQYIGAYMMSMGGLDAIVFTGGIGENEKDPRENVLKGLDFMGLEIDKKANQVKGKETEITTENSTIKAFAIPTNEELVIARATRKLVL